MEREGPEDPPRRVPSPGKKRGRGRGVRARPGLAL